MSKSKIYEREADPISAGDYEGDNMIDPMAIFGFPNLANGEDPIITDHPMFPNPRTGVMDRALVEEIKENEAFLEPITIYFYEDEDGEEIPVLINGKTRLTAVAEHWAEDGHAFREIPYSVVTGTLMEVRFLQAKLNLNDTRRPLSAVETADFLSSMEREYELSEDDQLLYLQKPINQGTLRWLREAKAVANDPIARKALEKGDIDPTTAKAVAKIVDPVEKVKAVEKVVEAKAGGATEREARKTVTDDTGAPLRSTNKTTLKWGDALEWMKEYYNYAKEAHRKGLNSEDVDWASPASREDFMADQEYIARYDMLTVFFKISDLSLREQFETIEEWFGAEECVALKITKWMPPRPQGSVKPSAEAPEAKEKAPAKPKAPKAKQETPAAPATKKKPLSPR